LLLDKTGLEKCVPHRGMMFILDRLVTEDLDTLEVQTEVDISSDARFYRPDMGGVPVWVGFEYMAQSIAVLSGRQGQLLGRPPRIGFIMGIRDFTCAISVFPCGSIQTIEVRQEFRDGPVVSFVCSIRQGETKVVSAIVNALEVDDTNMNLIMGEGCND
jgi:predicted hotdog family 3-hydroxylacyl-ACP dehydratase